MVRSCCVKSCRAEWSPISPLSFFSIPMKNEILLNKWKEAIPDSKIGKYSAICSKHFLPNEVQRTGAKTMLKKNAVPTIFIDKHFQQALSDNNFNITPDSAYTQFNLSRDTNDEESCPLIEISHNTSVKNVRRNIEDQQSVDTSSKKDISVQTSPHRVGPSKREIQLQRKIRILQAKLRRREKRIARIVTKKLVNHSKHSGKSPNVRCKVFAGKSFKKAKNHSYAVDATKETALTSFIDQEPDTHGAL